MHLLKICKWESIKNVAIKESFKNFKRVKCFSHCMRITDRETQGMMIKIIGNLRLDCLGFI